MKIDSIVGWTQGYNYISWCYLNELHVILMGSYIKILFLQT